jgi:hypothetical protein
MNKERGGGLVFLAAGIYGLLFSIGLPFGRWNQPGPGVFPFVISVLLCISGVSWLIRGKKKETMEMVRLGDFFRKFMSPLKIVGITAAFILALQPLGYLLTSTLYTLVLFLWVSRYRIRVALILAIVFGVGTWLFFEKLLTTPLPKGVLPL